MVTYLSPSYKPICTHIHTYILFVLQISHYHTYVYIYSVSPHRVEYLLYCTDSPLSYIYIYIHIYSVSPHRVNICFSTQRPSFTAQVAHYHIYIYTYIYTPFHNTESTYVFPHRWPSFTTLGKPTIWMVTDLSPSYIHAYVHTYTVCFTDITSYYIYIYSVSPHWVKYLFYRTDIPPSYIYISYIDTVLQQRVNIVLPHRWPSFTTLGKTNNQYGALSTNTYNCFSPYRVKYLSDRTDSPVLRHWESNGNVMMMMMTMMIDDDNNHKITIIIYELIIMTTIIIIMTIILESRWV